MPQKITKTVVKNATLTGKNYYITDSELSGFALRVSAKGYQVFVLRHRTGAGAKDYTIGTPEDLSVSEARDEAMKLKVDLKKTRPKKSSSNEKSLAYAMSLYLADKCDKEYGVKWTFKRPGVKRELPSHIKNIELCFESFMKFMRDDDILLKDVKREDVQKYHAYLGICTPIQANRFFSYLKTFFNYYLSQGDISENPCAGIRKYKEDPNKQGIPHQKFQEFIELLKQEEDRMAADAVIFALLTGIRTRTAISIAWENTGQNNYVDFENKSLVIHKSQSKTKKYFNIPILNMAIDHLNTIERTKSRFVFSSTGDSHISRKRYSKAFYSALKKLDIEEGLKDYMTPYCTRHSFTNYLVNRGMPFEDIAQLLTHKSTKMLKERYGHLETGYKDHLRGRLEDTFK
jgi:integrase